MTSIQRTTLFIGLLLTAIIFMSGPVSTNAQMFGKNKVQYKNFEWMYLQSNHFDIYFSQDGRTIADFAAHAAESALVSIERTLKYKITNRIPFIIYNSHNDFQQTNVISMYLEEGIGGVTELFKNRVVLPFEGSYKNFRHVIHHELVHAVLNDMFYGGSIQSILTNNIRLQLPLWLNEGFAEYESLGGWDCDSDMFLRDATVSNYLPPIQFLGGYFAYRGGQSVWWYIAEKYGKEKVGEILRHIRNTSSVERGFREAIGLDLEELSERWQKEQKVLYYADVAKRKSPQDFAKRLTNHRKMGNFYNTSPAISPSGDKIAFISDRSGFFSVYIMDANNGENVRTIVEGQQSSDFEELHLLTPGITWSPDGKSIALSVKAGSSDAIFLIDVESGEKKKLPVELDGIFSVEWSPRGDQIAFTGNTPSQSDIYVYDLETKDLINVTDDIFSDSHPAWSADGKTVYFVSDRKQFIEKNMVPENFSMRAHDFRTTDIYSADVATKAIRRITATDDVDETNPVITSDSTRMLFISNRNGINNIFVRDLRTGSEYPISNSISGIYQLSLSHDDNKLAFASMDEAGFDIFLLRNPLEKQEVAALEITEFMQRQKFEANIARQIAKRDTSDERTAGQHAGNDLYGSDIQLDLSNRSTRGDTSTVVSSGPRITFGQMQPPVPERKVFLPKSVVDSGGNFIVNKYKLSFSPDLVYGNAEYNTFYGVLGTTTIAFSDLLGDHQIYLLTNMMIDFKNSDYALAYYYLPNRIDWGIRGFHSARFIMDTERWLYRFRNYGVGIDAQLPLNKFHRLDLGLTWMNISRENVDLPLPVDETSILLPNISYVHDNTRWGTWAPIMGTRYQVSLYGSVGVSSDPLTFSSVTFDARKYYNFATDASVVLRGSGGASFGASPQRFFIGGTENWIAPIFETGRIPIENINDFAFLTPALPLRGYNYNARIATRYVLGNAELRFPLVKYFLGGLLPYLMSSVNTAIFIDAGSAWDDFDTYRAFGKNEHGETVAKDLLIGTGMGLRLFFLGLPWKFDFAWGYTGSGFTKPTFYISLGGDF